MLTKFKGTIRAFDKVDFYIERLVTTPDYDPGTCSYSFPRGITDLISCRSFGLIDHHATAFWYLCEFSFVLNLRRTWH